MSGLIAVKQGVVFPIDTLKKILCTSKRIVTFAVFYQLDAYQFGALLRLVRPGDTVAQVLSDSAVLHSNELQDFIVDLGYEYLLKRGDVDPDAEVEEVDDALLKEIFQQYKVSIVNNLDELAEGMADALVRIKPKEAKLVLKKVRKLHRTVNKIGTYEVQIGHAPREKNLVVFDVSGSVAEATVVALVDEVIAMAMAANATLAIVSDTTTWWRPGEATRQSVLAAAEYGGTRYETLAALFDEDWSTVITVADYDSSWSSREALGRCKGQVGQVLDISLVERQSFLSECVGQLAQEVRPIMVAGPSLFHAFGG